MIKVTWDEGFKKAYRKKVKNNDGLKKRFWKALELFIENPFNPRMRTHKLTGKLARNKGVRFILPFLLIISIQPYPMAF